MSVVCVSGPAGLGRLSTVLLVVPVLRGMNPWAGAPGPACWCYR